MEIDIAEYKLLTKFKYVVIEALIDGSLYTKDLEKDPYQAIQDLVHSGRNRGLVKPAVKENYPQDPNWDPNYYRALSDFYNE